MKILKDIHIRIRLLYKMLNGMENEPIWVTAEKNNLISATYFWVGSEAP